MILKHKLILDINKQLHSLCGYSYLYQMEGFTYYFASLSVKELFKLVNLLNEINVLKEYAKDYSSKGDWNDYKEIQEKVNKALDKINCKNLQKTLEKVIILWRKYPSFKVDEGSLLKLLVNVSDQLHVTIGERPVLQNNIKMLKKLKYQDEKKQLKKLKELIKKK